MNKISNTIIYASYLYVHFIHFIEEIFYTVFIFTVMYHDKSNVSCSNKCTHEPLVKFVYNFQMHICCFPSMFIYKI